MKKRNTLKEIKFKKNGQKHAGLRKLLCPKVTDG